ncbi:MAG: gluconokinase [Burkholderiales bacterium]|nr:MAG: gluconokinase [Burkholderiales bacterium]
MGVAGCGKSSLGVAVAQQLGLPIVEGDDFHSASSLAKMKRGVALNDADRAGWLKVLCTRLQDRPSGMVLTCSALKRTYRDQLRAAMPSLRFVFLDISSENATRRVAERAASHFFSSKLVESQFATLEEPSGEEGVLSVDATLPLVDLQARVCDWVIQSSPIIPSNKALQESV